LALRPEPFNGYRYIQIDDTFQQGEGAGTPESWLEWNEKLPGGMAGYVKMTREAGFEPGIWIGAMFKDKAFVDAHRDWFIPDAEGNPLEARFGGRPMDVATDGRIVRFAVRPEGTDSIEWVVRFE
jgi:hypothetical protein